MKFTNIVKILIIALLIAAVVTTGTIMYFKVNAKIHILDGPGMINTREGELTGIYFTRGGGKDGEYLMCRLTEQEDYTVLFEYEYAPPLSYTKTTASFVLPEGSLIPFMDICRSTGCLIYAYNSTPGDVVLDGATTDIIFYLGDDGIKLDSTYDYPAIDSSLFGDVQLQLEQLIEQHKPIIN